MMKIFNLTFASFLMAFLYSCNGDNSEKKNNADTNTDTLTSKQNIVESDNLIDSQNFQEFWLGFRKIVLSKEDKGFKEVVALPFEVYGFEDSDPRIKLSDIDSINLIFKKFLSESNVSYPNINNHLELINNITQLEVFPGYAASENWRRIEQMEFRNDGNGWLLSRIYLNTKELKDQH
ncbi:MAG: hypothetical protein IPN22_11185 [Bacteroidetes bacterium]|nr:hypothetical protein [Bacteroidota bacterium]